MGFTSTLDDSMDETQLTDILIPLFVGQPQSRDGLLGITQMELRTSGGFSSQNTGENLHTYTTAASGTHLALMWCEGDLYHDL